MRSKLPKQITDHYEERASNDSEFRQSGEDVPENRVLALIHKNGTKTSHQMLNGAVS